MTISLGPIHGPDKHHQSLKQSHHTVETAAPEKFAAPVEIGIIGKHL
jgi:hypothetical protein